MVKLLTQALQSLLFFSFFILGEGREEDKQLLLNGYLYLNTNPMLCFS